ncbi:MAG TPA: NPCBM/NEW2 domain-containing protein [Polyangiaceae bacterium]|nr:NPCBM/NEW2 domain-containing protein [Polyangiaceae bacterium]
MLATGCSGVAGGGAGDVGASAAPAARALAETPALALTPPMGFNDWNAFGCDVNEKLIRETADFFVSSGLKDAGYVQLNIDDCWSLRERDASGKLVPDPAKFPSGIRGVADYVHRLGLKLGIYGDAGSKTCAGYPGSLGREKLDAQTWADWGVDYLKYDNCYNESDGSREDFVRRYTAMRQALDETGRPIVYSICEWGQSQPWQWASGVGHLWRTTGDISDNWSSLRSIIAANAPLAEFAGPGHWNDPDMLEIGNGGMTPTEYRTHMSLWSMMAAPLIIGTDLRKASADTLAILGNRDIIALDQDPLGQQARVVSDSAGLAVFSKPLQGGDVAIALYNSSDVLARVGVSATDAGLPSSAAYALRELWSGAHVQTGPAIAAGVAAHGAVVYRASVLADATSLPPALSVDAQSATLVPSVPGGTELTTRVTNQGVTDARAVELELQAPAGWVVRASDAPNIGQLAPGASIAARWNVRAPASAAAGQYTLPITARYGWGSTGDVASTGSELVLVVVVPPSDGVTPLSALRPVRLSNGLGPVERDMSNGGAGEGDGQLIRIAGTYYTRGLGTQSPSQIVYYLGGRCSELSAVVGIDAEAKAVGSARFTISAGERVVAQSGPLSADSPAQTLTAKLGGAQWLTLASELATTSTGAGVRTSWAMPMLRCGKSSKPTHPELTIDSFEAGSPGFGVRAPGAGNGVAPSSAFHTDGNAGLELTASADGSWFGRRLEKPLDLRGMSRLAVDLRTGETGTSAELAVEFGPNHTWCQGGHWAWTNPHSSKTIVTALSELGCPAGMPLDPSRIEGVWVFAKGGTFVIDNVRAQ